MKPLDFDKIKQDLIAKFGYVRDCDVMSYVMFPKVLEEFIEFKQVFGPVECLDTRVFFVGPKIAEDIDVTIDKGKTLHIKVLAVGEIKEGKFNL
jgi:pyruvate carboxylase